VKVIICGSRELMDFHWADQRIGSLVRSIAYTTNRSLKTVLSGGCRGLDEHGEKWAETHGFEVQRFPADWSQGKKAGPLRNQAMVDEADAVVAIAYPDSRGTKDCVRRAIAKGIPVAMLILPRSRR
jgi:hypothetical protein